MLASNKDDLKNSLSIEQIEDLMAELGGEPINHGNYLICKTICHGGESHKLYYYDNTHLFRCYTECDDTFDIYSLILKIQKLTETKKGYYNSLGEYTEREWELPDAIIFIADYFGYTLDEETTDFVTLQIPDWELFKRYEKNDTIQLHNQQDASLITYDARFLQNYPQPHIYNWEKEGITYQTIKKYNIRYNPVSGGVLIPHFNIDGEIVGIRERTFIKEYEEYGKYRPAYINKIIYKHPLSFNLYNLNFSFNNIKQSGIAIVGEGEKFCMMYDSFFGSENNITVACCGSSLIGYQVQLLLNLNIKEIVIAFDKQFQTIGDTEWKKWTNKLKQISAKYGSIVKISYMFDKEDLLSYKASPIDNGKDIFLYLFQHRFSL